MNNKSLKDIFKLLFRIFYTTTETEVEHRIRDIVFKHYFEHCQFYIESDYKPIVTDETFKEENERLKKILFFPDEPTYNGFEYVTGRLKEVIADIERSNKTIMKAIQKSDKWKGIIDDDVLFKEWQHLRGIVTASNLEVSGITVKIRDTKPEDFRTHEFYVDIFLPLVCLYSAAIDNMQMTAKCDNRMDMLVSEQKERDGRRQTIGWGIIGIIVLSVISLIFL